MNNYVLINDIHLSDRAPASCTDTYLDDLFDLLAQAAQIAVDHRAGIVLAGDVFHHKAPSRTSHGTVMRLVQWALDTPVPFYVVAGNHDLSHDRVDSLFESQPLGVVLACDAMDLLDGWIDDGAGDFVYGVPWQMSFDPPTVTDVLEDYRTLWYSDDTPKLVVTHAPLYPPGQELKYEYFPATEWAQAMGNQGTVHYGHVHEPHGIYEVDGVTFSNCGALSRGSLHEHNLTRIPSVAMWNADTGTITHIELNAKPADQVFRLAQAAEKRADILDRFNFLASVESTRLDVISTAAVLKYVRETQSDPELVTFIERLLDEVAR